MSDTLSPLAARLRDNEHLLEAMRLLGRIPSAHTDQARLIGELERAICQVMECALARVWLLDRHTFDVLRHPSVPLPLTLDQHLLGEVALERRSLNLKDATRDVRWTVIPGDRLPESSAFSLLCAPLVNRQDGLVGIIELRSSALGYFPPADEKLLNALAQQAAAMLEQQQLFSGLVTRNYELLDLKLRLEERTAEVELLFDLERAAAVARSLDEAFDGALERTRTTFQPELVAVLLLNTDTRSLFVQRAVGPKAHLLPLHSAHADAWLLQTVFEGQHHTHSEWDEGPGLSSPLLQQVQAKTWACVAMVRSGEAPIGALLVVNPKRVPSGFDERDLHTLSLISSRMALSHRLATALDEERKAERLSAIGGALSGIIHDLKTPLTLLAGYARALEREENRSSRSEIRESHKRQIAQIQVMIQEVLAFARGQREALLRKTLVGPLLEELEELLVAELANTSSEHPIQLHMQRDYGGYVRMDAPKLKRALMNLAKNACEAMLAQGGQLIVRCYESHTHICFDVTDTGPGIAAEMQGRLFQSFSTHGKAQGSGLGLAIVKTIVDQHEGQLEVLTSPHGTTFSIRLSRDT